MTMINRTARYLRVKKFFVLFSLLLPIYVSAGTVDMFFLAGQSNASPELERSLEKVMERVAPDSTAEVCRSNKGGTHSSAWMDESGNPGERWAIDLAIFKACIQKVVDAGDVPNILGYVWWQGERDALQIEATLESYKLRLTEHFKGIIEEFGKQPFRSYVGEVEIIDVLIGYNPLSPELNGELEDAVAEIRNHKRCVAGLFEEVNVVESQHHPRLVDGRTNLWHVTFPRLDTFSLEVLTTLNLN